MVRIKGGVQRYWLYSETGVPEVMDYWSNGVLENCSTGIMDCWSTWSNGVLEYWSTEVLLKSKRKLLLID